MPLGHTPPPPLNHIYSVSLADNIMATTRIVKRSYGGYCVGVGVEYPGIIVSAESDDDLVSRFQEAVPSYKRALAKYGIEEKSMKEVLTIDVQRADKQ